MFDKTIVNIISVLIIIYNSLLLLWLCCPREILIQAILEIFVVKLILSIIVIYFGKIVHQETREYGLKNMISISPVNTWFFVVSIIFSFGIPGFLLAKPVFVLVSNWYNIIPYISFLILILMVISFVFASINISPVFIKKPAINQTGLTDMTGTITLLLALLLIITISVMPDYIHKFSSNYFNSFIVNRGY
jgi:hypothetical protein